MTLWEFSLQGPFNGPGAGSAWTLGPTQRGLPGACLGSTVVDPGWDQWGSSILCIVACFACSSSLPATGIFNFTFLYIEGFCPNFALDIDLTSSYADRIGGFSSLVLPNIYT